MTREIISSRDIQTLRIKFRDSAHAVAEPNSLDDFHEGNTLRQESFIACEQQSYPYHGVAQTPDNYTERLIKYIPAEVIALYLTLDALIRSSPQFPASLYWAVFLFCFAATYLYLWRIEKVRKQLQLHISGSAFVVWVFAIGGPFVHLSWYNPIYAGLLLPMFTFLVALVEA